MVASADNAASRSIFSFAASRLGLDPSLNRFHAPLVYHENYSFADWPPNHTFPMDKFQHLRNAVLTKQSSSSSSHQEARRYSRLTHKDNKAHMEFHLNRTWIQQNYDDLPCFSEWVRIAQWYNYALELTQPHRTLPRRIVRFEEYNNNVRNNRTSKLQDLVRALGVEPVVPPLPFDAPRARHRMLYTHAQARRAKQLFRQVASVETWNLFRPYFENQPWNTVEEEANEGVVVTG